MKTNVVVENEFLKKIMMSVEITLLSLLARMESISSSVMSDSLEAKTWSAP